MIYLTTVHCQDFKDIAGNAAVGRVTTPMVYPLMSRLVYAFFVVFWAIYLRVYVMLQTIPANALLAFSVFMAVFILTFKSVKADLNSYRMYHVGNYNIFLNVEF